MINKGLPEGSPVDYFASVSCRYSNQQGMSELIIALNRADKLVMIAIFQPL